MECFPKINQMAKVLFLCVYGLFNYGIPILHNQNAYLLLIIFVFSWTLTKHVAKTIN